MSSRLRLLAPLLLAPFATLGLVAGTLPARAHPHVQVSVRTAIILNDAGEIAALRHAWTFDEAFSAFSTTGLDTNKDGKLDREELAPLAKINVESLHEYGFFSFLKKGKEAAEFGDVKDYHLSHDGKALTLHFTLPVGKKLPAAKDARLEVYDPSYFVAFEFDKTSPVSVEGGKSPCAAKLTQPNASVVSRLSQMGESFFQSMNGANADWATVVRFECK